MTLAHRRTLKEEDKFTRGIVVVYRSKTLLAFLNNCIETTIQLPYGLLDTPAFVIKFFQSFGQQVFIVTHHSPIMLREHMHTSGATVLR